MSSKSKEVFGNQVIFAAFVPLVLSIQTHI
nr:MAG TPA: hypothetical protein [Caudoviricetes sp.]